MLLAGTGTNYIMTALLCISDKAQFNSIQFSSVYKIKQNHITDRETSRE